MKAEQFKPGITILIGGIKYRVNRNLKSDISTFYIVDLEGTYVANAYIEGETVIFRGLTRFLSKYGIVEVYYSFDEIEVVK